MEENREEMQQPPKETKEEKRLPGQDVYEWVQALVCSVLTVVMLFTFAVRLIGVDGHSMVPTLQHTDRLVVLSPILYHDYKAGDIVVLRKGSFSRARPWTSTSPPAASPWTAWSWTSPISTS